MATDVKMAILGGMHVLLVMFEIIVMIVALLSGISSIALTGIASPFNMNAMVITVFFANFALLVFTFVWMRWVNGSYYFTWHALKATVVSFMVMLGTWLWASDNGYHTNMPGPSPPAVPTVYDAGALGALLDWKFALALIAIGYWIIVASAVDNYKHSTYNMVEGKTMIQGQKKMKKRANVANFI